MRAWSLTTVAVALVAAGPAPSTPTTAPPDPCPMPAGTAAPSGGYFTASGQSFTDPTGKLFTVRGINIEWPFLKKAITDSKANPASLKFKNINLIRVNIFDADVTPQTIAELQAYTATTTLLGITLLLEYHEYPGIAIGSTLAKVADMYRQLAAAAKGNGYVWFATQNEPSTGGSLSDINAEIRAIYGSVRSTGNNTVILVNPYGGYNPQGIDLSGMTNIGWDLHYYAWLPNSGTPLASEVAQARSVANIPPVIGEYGPASGNGIDAGGYAVVQEVHNSGLSSIAWAWETQNPGNPAPGDLLYPGWDASSPLTDFGSQVAAHIQQGGTPTPGTYDPQAFSQQTCQLSQVIYPNAAAQASDQIDQAMQQVIQEQQGQPQSGANSGPTQSSQGASPPPVASPGAPVAPSQSIAAIQQPSAAIAPPAPPTATTKNTATNNGLSTDLQQQLGQLQAAQASVLSQIPPNTPPTLPAGIPTTIASLPAPSLAGPPMPSLAPAVQPISPTKATTLTPVAPATQPLASPPTTIPAASSSAPTINNALSAMMPQPIQQKHKPRVHHRQHDTENDDDSDNR